MRTREALSPLIGISAPTKQTSLLRRQISFMNFSFKIHTICFAINQTQANERKRKHRVSIPNPLYAYTLYIFFWDY